METIEMDKFIISIDKFRCATSEEIYDYLKASLKPGDNSRFSVENYEKCQKCSGGGELPFSLPGPPPSADGDPLPTQPEALVVGDAWHVRFPGGKTLSTEVILDVGEKTVLLKELWEPSPPPERYEMSDVKWVEKINSKVVEQYRKSLKEIMASEQVLRDELHKIDQDRYRNFPD